MLKYFVILAVLLCACFYGCGDNLNPLESQDSNPQVKMEIQLLVVAKDTSLAELMGELYDLWFRVSITNLGDKEVTIDQSSFSMYDMKGSVIYSTEGVYIFDPTSDESISATTIEYILGLNNETTFILKPKTTESVGLFTIVSTEPTGEWNLVYGNRQVVIPVQKRIEQAIASGKKIGDEPASGGQDSAGNVGNQSKEIVSSDGAPMVLITAGEFQMGSNDESELESARPVHKVYLDAFYMDKYEVTNTRFKKFVDATGYKIPDFGDDAKYYPNYPVSSLSWNDAKAYADWAGKRLPTEAEWEKAARGGLVGKKFPWGDMKPGSNHCNLGGADDGYNREAPVGSFPPNGYGLYDMAGNVKEWCADWFAKDYYSESPYRNPQGPVLGSYRMTRGGGWNDSYVSVAHRYPADPHWDNIGFRCVMDATK
ncbi:MAG: formylglycine-generating enzyme family protein [Candidatus Doudnabacteria bacterium]